MRLMISLLAVLVAALVSPCAVVFVSAESFEAAWTAGARLPVKAGGDPPGDVRITGDIHQQFTQPSAAYDAQADRVWVAYVRVVDFDEAETRQDQVVVRSKAPTASEWDAGTILLAGPGTRKFAPEISVSPAGTAWVAAAVMDGNDNWDVRLFRKPSIASGFEEVPFHSDPGKMEFRPHVAAGRFGAWVVYEAWEETVSSDKAHAVRIEAKYCSDTSGGCSAPFLLSTAGQNYRPRALQPCDGEACGTAGKRCALAVVWDSYRDEPEDLDGDGLREDDNYNIMMRRVYLNDGGLPPDGCSPRSSLTCSEEEALTTDGMQDTQADVMEDMQGNIWVAWLKTRHMETAPDNGFRDVHVMFHEPPGTSGSLNWPADSWRVPLGADPVCDGGECRTEEAVSVSTWDLREHHRNPDDAGSGCFTNLSPIGLWNIRNRPALVHDSSNRVWILFGAGGYLFTKVQDGTAWALNNAIYSSQSSLLPLTPDNSCEPGWWAVNCDGQAYCTTAPARLCIRSYRALQVPPGSSRTEDSLFLMIETLSGVLQSRRIGIGALRQTACTYGPANSLQRQEQIRPAFARDERIAGSIYFAGDAHGHSVDISDGVDPSDAMMNYARDVAKLDFYALTDHAEWSAYRPGWEAYCATLAERFHEDGRFVVFDGYEFSSLNTTKYLVPSGDPESRYTVKIPLPVNDPGEPSDGYPYRDGHRIVLYETPLPDRFCSFIPEAGNLRPMSVYELSKRLLVLWPTVPSLVSSHNMLETMGLGNYFGHMNDPDQTPAGFGTAATWLEPGYEIASHNGTAEEATALWLGLPTPPDSTERPADPPGGSVQYVPAPLRAELFGLEEPTYPHYYSYRQLLNGGRKLGVIGNSDAHSIQSLGRDRTYVLAPRLTRRDIMASVRARLTYATDGRGDSADLLDGPEGVSTDWTFPTFRIDTSLVKEDSTVVLMGQEVIIRKALENTFSVFGDCSTRAGVGMQGGAVVCVRMGQLNQPGPIGEILVQLDADQVSRFLLPFETASFEPGTYAIYLRVENREGSRAWTSPFFVTFE